MAEQRNEHYVQDTPYTWSFFDVQSPISMDLAAQLNGVERPDPQAPFHYCELGSGNGITTNLLAAAYPQGHFYGVDFNPEHTANSTALAEAAGLTNITHLNHDFARFIQADTPAFDYITLHGVYSWVDKAVRDEIIQVLQHKLKPGGLVYVSYNAMPGWAELLPLWKMIQEYTADTALSSLEKAEQGLQYLKFLRDRRSHYFEETPYAKRYLDRMIARDPSYLAHEFCNGCFEPQYIADVARDMASAKLNYVGDSRPYRNMPYYAIPSRFREHIAAGRSVIDQESRKSFVLNDFFRRDIFHAGQPRRSDGQIATSIGERYLGLSALPDRLSPKTMIGRKKVSLDTPLNHALMPLLERGRHTGNEILAHESLQRWSRKEIVAAIKVLIAADYAIPLAQPAIDYKAFNKRCHYRLALPINRHFLQQRLFEDAKCYVASEVLGSAIRVNLQQGLFLLAMDSQAPDNVVDNAYRLLQQLNPRHITDITVELDGQPSQYWLRACWQRFQARDLPRYIQLGIVTAMTE